MFIKNWLKSTIACIALCGSVATTGATIDKVIAFGDSITDNGNVYNMLLMAKKVIPLVPLIPKTPPYHNGRFTNGLVWIEHLTNSLNVPLVNYAYGGAWAEGFNDSKQILPPSLGMQVSMYSVAPSTIVDFNMHQHLYIIWVGANDYLKGRHDYEYATTNTVESIANQVDWLLRMGAKNIAIINAPDLSKAPSAIAKGADFVLALQKMITKHNAKLVARLDAIRHQYPTAKVIHINVTEDFDDLILNPAKYGLKNVTQACYTGGYLLQQNQYQLNSEVDAAKQAKFEITDNSILMEAYLNGIAASKGHMACNNPEEYLFWDNTHPTGIVHQLIGIVIFAKLAESGILSNM